MDWDAYAAYVKKPAPIAKQEEPVLQRPALSGNIEGLVVNGSSKSNGSSVGVLEVETPF
jgi:hypothetical protein